MTSRIQKRVESLSSAASSDPLYLSKLTFGQKVRRAFFFLAPVIAAIAIPVLVFLHYSNRPTPKPSINILSPR